MKAFGEESAVLGALRGVVDPELGIDIVELALIRQIDLSTDPVTIKMVLTTPFCPWGPELIKEVEDVASEGLGRPVKVKLLAERWNPADAGLEW